MEEMLPMYFVSIKGSRLGSTDLLTQSASTPSSSSTSPQSNFVGDDQLSHHNIANTGGSSQEFFNDNSLSNAPSSYHSTATLQDIDVDCISQPHSQSQANDLSMEESPIVNNPPMDNTIDMRQRIGTHHHNMLSISTTEFVRTRENNQEDENEAYDLFFADFIEHKQNTSNNTEFGFDNFSADNINDFGTLEFTPPDSPVEQVELAETDSLANLFIPLASRGQMSNETSTSFQSSSTSALQPYQRAYDFEPSTFAQQPLPIVYLKDPVYSKPTKVSKVPVYKQIVFSTNMPDEEEIDVVNVTEINDAYSFDDEEDLGLQPINTTEKELDPNDFWKQQVAVQKKKSFPVQEQLKAPGTPVAAATLRSALIGIINQSAEETTSTQSTSEEPKVIIQFETLFQRRKNRILNEFINTVSSESRECAIGDSADEPLKNISQQENMDQPPIPKLIIKRVSMDDYPRERNEKKKKRENDSDGEETDQAKRRKIRKYKKTSSEYEVHVVERDDSEKQHDEKPMLNMLSKKQRFLNQWEEAQQQEQRDKEYDQDFNSQSEAVKQRLSKLGSAEGFLPEGTFVMLKSDLFNESAALWRVVDKQRILQKYIPQVEPFNGNITYQSSTVYSAWSESIAHEYYRVATKIIKQTRNESIVELEVAWSDLPAMTSVQDDNDHGTSEDESSSQQETLESYNAILRDPIRLSMHTFMLAMIVHASTLSHFQELRAKNNPNFQQAEDAIDDMTDFCLMNLRSWANMSEAIEEYLCTYTQMAVIKAENNLTEVCQSCAAVTVENVVQLFSRDRYDEDTLECLEQDDRSDFLPAFELLVCSTCAMVTCLFHKCYHLRFTLLKLCEDKLEEVEQQYPEYSADKIIDVVKNDENWRTAIINEYVDIWYRAQGTEEDILGGKCLY